MTALMGTFLLLLCTLIHANWNMVGHDAQQSSLSANSIMAGNGIPVFDFQLSFSNIIAHNNKNNHMNHYYDSSSNKRASIVNNSNNMSGDNVTTTSLAPIIADDIGVFFIAVNSSVYAFSLTDPKMTWPAPYVVGGGVVWTSISRCIDSIIVVGSDGSMHSINFVTGSIQWKILLPSPSSSGISSLTLPICDSDQIFITVNSQAIAVAIATGSVSWVLPLGNVNAYNLVLGGTNSSAASALILLIAIDHALICVNRTSGNKLYTVPRDGVSKGLVINNDNTILLVASGYSVYVYSAVSGNIQCPFTTNYLISSTPALSADFATMYITSMDNHVYAVSTSSCVCLWNITMYGSFSPTLDGNGGLYVNTNNAIVSLNITNGNVLWSSNLQRSEGEMFSNLALDVNGRIYVSSNKKGRVLSLGLSLPVILSQYQLAVASALVNSTSQAISLLSPICDLLPQVQQLPSSSLSTQQLLQATNTVCQTLNNLNNGLDPYGHARNYVNAQPFSAYANLLSLQLPMLQNLEVIEQNFSASEGNIQQQLLLAQQAHKLLQATEDQWSDTISKDQALLKGYSTSLAQIRQQMNVDFNATGPLFDQLEASLEQQISDLKVAISNLQADEAKAKSDAAHEMAEGMLLGMIPFIGGALRAEKLAKAAADLKEAAEDAIKIQKDQVAIDEMKEEMSLIENLQNYTITLESLNSQIDEGNQTLPELLPEIFMDEVDQAKISIILTLLMKSLSSFPGGNQLINTIEDFVALSQSNIDGVLAWYSVAAKIQHAQGALDLLKLRDDLVQINILKDMSQLVAVEQARHLVDEHRKQQSFLSLQTVNNEIAQFNFWSLRTYPNPLSVDPSSSEIQLFMQNFQAAVVEYQNELDTNATEQMWIQYKYNSTQDKFAFEYFWSSGTITLEVPLPFTANNTLATNFFNVRMRDVRVLLLPASACTGSDVNPSFKHDGSSLMVDSGGNIFNFTHDSNWNYGFRYDPSTLCPNTQACSGADSPDCPSGINFSPYGRWYIDVSYSPGIPDRTKINAIALQFQVTYQQGGPQSTPFFARADISSQYPIPKSDFCSK